MPAIPPQEVAEWPTPNYDNPATEISLVVGVQAPLLITMLLVVTARFSDRIYFHRRPDASDWVIAFAFMCCMVCNIIPWVGFSFGMARHIWDVKLEWVASSMKLVLSFRAFWAVAVGLTKISICLTYLRLFPNSKLNRWFCRGMIVYCGASMTAFLFATTFNCQPVSDFWNVTLPHRNCPHEQRLLMASTVQKCVSEVMVFAWPAYFIWSLRLPPKTRLGLMGFFCLGTVVSIIGLVKLWYFNVYFHQQHDLSWIGGRLLLIEITELNLALTCACLPHIKPITKLVCCWVRRRKEGGSNGSNIGRRRTPTPAGLPPTSRRYRLAALRPACLRPRHDLATFITSEDHERRLNGSDDSDIMLRSMPEARRPIITRPSTVPLLRIATPPPNFNASAVLNNAFYPAGREGQAQNMNAGATANLRVSFASEVSRDGQAANHRNSVASRNSLGQQQQKRISPMMPPRTAPMSAPNLMQHELQGYSPVAQRSPPAAGGTAGGSGLTVWELRGLPPPAAQQMTPTRRRHAAEVEEDSE